MSFNRSLLFGNTSSSPLRHKAEKAYHPELDGLRGISILLVFISHYGLYFLPGAFGVNVFFFVSGFLITRLLQVELAASNNINIKGFYVRRVLRLAPALLVFVTFFAFLWFYLFSEVDWYSIVAAILYYFNYYRLYADDFFVPFGVLWSLAIEEHYYIFYPALFLLLGGSGKKLFHFLIAVIVISLLWRFALMYLISNDLLNIDTAHLKKSTDTRMDSIAFGALLAVMANQTMYAQLLDKLANLKMFYTGVTLIILGLSFKLSVFSEIESIFSLQYTLRYFLTGTGLFLVLNYILFNPEAVFFRSLLSGRLVQYFGKISYSLYLWHLAILLTLKRLYPDESLTNIYLIGAGLSLVAAIVSFHLVESKVNRLRRKWGSNVVV